MIRTVSIAIVAVSLGSTLPSPAIAQDNTLGGALFGGAAGAIIGGAATGRASGAAAGAVIGGATGAIIGSQYDAPRGGYFWNNNRCYYQWPDGRVARVQRRNCE